MNGPAPSLPVEVRARLGDELAADLDATYRTLLDRGWTPEAALARARTMVVPDAHALDRLTRIHRPLYRRLVARCSARGVQRGERMAVIAVALSSLAMLAALLLRADIFREPSAFLLPVLVSGSGVVAAVAAKAFHLLVKRPTRLSELRAGLAAPLAASTITLLAGLGGTLVDLYRFAAQVESAVPESSIAVVAFVGDTAALLALALAFALAGGLGWFLLLLRIVAVEAEAGAPHPGPLLDLLHTPLSETPS